MAILFRRYQFLHDSTGLVWQPGHTKWGLTIGLSWFFRWYRTPSSAKHTQRGSSRLQEAVGQWPITRFWSLYSLAVAQDWIPRMNSSRSRFLTWLLLSLLFSVPMCTPCSWWLLLLQHKEPIPEPQGSRLGSSACVSPKQAVFSPLFVSMHQLPPQRFGNYSVCLHQVSLAWQFCGKKEVLT